MNSGDQRQVIKDTEQAFQEFYCSPSAETVAEIQKAERLANAATRQLAGVADIGKALQAREGLREQKASLEKELRKLDALDPNPPHIGKKAIRRIKLVLVLPKRRVTRLINAPKHLPFTDSAIEILLHNTADELEKSFAGIDFRLVEVAKDHFNIIHPAAEKRPQLAAS